MDEETKELVAQELLEIVGQQHKQIVMLQMQLALLNKKHAESQEAAGTVEVPEEVDTNGS